MRINNYILKILKFKIKLILSRKNPEFHKIQLFMQNGPIFRSKNIEFFITN